jgi:hypothetical protein
VIGHDNIDRNFLGFEFEAKLFLERSEDARAGIGGRIGLRRSV